MWVQEDGARGRDRERYLGLSSRGEGLPAGPGLTNVTVGRTGTLGWLVMPYQTSTPAGLGGVTLAFEGRAVKKPQASQEKVVQRPSLNVLPGIHAPCLYLHVPVYTLSSSQTQPCTVWRVPMLNEKMPSRSPAAPSNLPCSQCWESCQTAVMSSTSLCFRLY